jgi:hypothetical protein
LYAACGSINYVYALFIQVKKLFLLNTIILSVLLIGCNKNHSDYYPQWHNPKSQYNPTLNSSNAFDAYAIASSTAEARVTRHLNRVNFTPGIQKRILDQLSEPLQAIHLAYNHTCQFTVDSQAAFMAPRFQKGWRMLGLTLVWSMEQAIRSSDTDKLIRDFLVATKFGFDIAKGSASDVSLGLSIVDHARVTLLPCMHVFSPKQLHQLSSELTKILNEHVKIDSALYNEQDRMMAGVQFVQDCYKKRDFDLLVSKLGPSILPAIKHVKQKILKKDGEIRIRYFEGFAQEGKNEITRLINDSKKPAKARVEPIALERKQRPWHRFAKHFFSTAPMILTLYDRAIAKTRLIALESLLQEQIHTNKKTPTDLSELPVELITDPYSGQLFVYRSEGTDYKIYSIGENLRDDGGQSDERGLNPDLMLEK